jgi:hypothetical protein
MVSIQETVSLTGRDRGAVTQTEKWWSMTCTQCGGFVPIRAIRAGEGLAPHLGGTANCVRCNAPNALTNAVLFVIDGKRLRRLRPSAPVDYVK